MTYRWLFGHLRTGKISRTLDLTGGRWRVSYDDADSLDASFPLRAWNQRAGRRVWENPRADSAVARQFMAVEWVDDTRRTSAIIAAGPIWTRDYDDKNGTLRVGASGLASVLDYRLVLPVLTAGMKPEAQMIALRSAELSLIAKRLAEIATAEVAAGLPLVLPSDADLGGPGTAHERNYPGHELGRVGERLRQLSEVEGGPEVQFVPRRRADDPQFVEWVMRIGTSATDMMLTQAGRPWMLDQTVPRTPVAGISVREHGRDLATRAFAAGEGDAEAAPIEWEASRALTDLGYPALDGVVTGTESVKHRSTLRAHVRGLLQRSDRPIETWDVDVNAADFWRLAPSFRPGDWVTVRVARDHPYLPPGLTRTRALEASGGGDLVTVQTAERKAEI